MNKKYLLISLTSTFFLAACAQQGDQAEQVEDNLSQEKTFICENQDEVKVSYQEEQATLELNDKNVVLNQAISGSGARYINEEDGLYGKEKMTEWHTKGDEAYFSYMNEQGEQIETSCQATQ